MARHELAARICTSEQRTPTRGANSFGAPGGGVSPRILALISLMPNERARTLRKNMSDGERKLWFALMARQIDGMRFRRQHPIGPYIADFVCLERHLVIEVDGGHHTEDDQIAHDARRDRWLNSEGYRILRFPAIDVFQNLEGVVDSIWAALQEAPAGDVSRHPHQERHRT